MVVREVDNDPGAQRCGIRILEGVDMFPSVWVRFRPPERGRQARLLAFHFFGEAIAWQR